MQTLKLQSNDRKFDGQNLTRVGVFLIGLTFATYAVVAHAQQKTRVSTIGFLSVSPSLDRDFVDALRELGYANKKNIVIEHRSAEGKSERLSSLAAELVTLKVDLIVTRGTAAATAAKHSTPNIPIV